MGCKGLSTIRLDAPGKMGASSCRVAQPMENRGKRPARRPSSARQAVRARWSRIVHHPPSSLQGKFTGDLDDSRAVCPVSRYHDRIGPQFLSTLLEKFCQQGESNTFGGSRARIVRSIFTRPRFRRARSGCVICFPSKDPASWHHRTAA